MVKVLMQNPGAASLALFTREIWANPRAMGAACPSAPALASGYRLIGAVCASASTTDGSGSKGFSLLDSLNAFAPACLPCRYGGRAAISGRMRGRIGSVTASVYEPPGPFDRHRDPSTGTGTLRQAQGPIDRLRDPSTG